MTLKYDEPPNGGWGWMVVFGVALINIFNQPLFSIFSLVYGDILREMSDGKATGLTLVMSIHICMGQFSGLLVKPLLKRLNIKYVSMLSVLSVSAGMIASSFATKLWQIVISFGIFTGLGLGLIISSTFLVINEYFTTRKSIAVGIAMSGTTISQMLIPLLVGVFLNKFGFSGTTLILGFVSLSGVVGAVLFEPLCRNDRKKDRMSNETTGEKNQFDLPDESYLKIEQTETLINNDLTRKEDGNEDPSKNATSKAEPKPSNTKGFLKSLMYHMDLHLLKEYNYISIFMGLSIGYFSSTSFRMQYVIGCVLLALFRLCLTLTRSYHLMLVFSFCTGYFRAMTVLNQNLIISDAVPKPYVPSAVGMTMVFKGITILAMGQPLGLLKDAFDYDLCINILNAALIVLVVWWSRDMIVIKRRKSKFSKQEDKTGRLTK